MLQSVVFALIVFVVTTHGGVPHTVSGLSAGAFAAVQVMVHDEVEISFFLFVVVY